MARRAARSAGDRLVFIEGLRGLAALYVVLGHICSMVDPGVFMGIRGQGPAWLRNLMMPFGYGHLAVAAFIVISGFCLQMSLFNGGQGEIVDFKRFFKRRALRILPPYYACLAISLVVAYYITPLGKGLPFSLYLPVTQDVVLSHVFMFHNISPDWMYKINGVLWSIAIEAQLYLLFPLIVLILAKAGRPVTLLVSWSAAAIVLAAWPQSMKLYPWYLGLFALGMATSHLAFKPPSWRGPNAFAASVMAVIAAYGCLYSVGHRFSLPVCDAWIGVFMVSVLYAGTVSKRLWLSKLLSIKPVAWLGAISYSLYLMHHPIMQAIHIYRPAWAADTLGATYYMLVVGLPLILLGCTLFWLAFERPFFSSRAKKVSERRKASGTAVVYLPIATESVEPATLR